jgi:hypothetical protein
LCDFWVKNVNAKLGAEGGMEQALTVEFS